MSHEIAPYVDAAFPLRGQSIPIDHGYPIFAALSGVIPVLRSRKNWSVHPVFGQYQRGSGILTLTDKSRLKLRLPSNEVGLILPLAQQTLTIAGNACTVGFPRIYPLINAPYLKSRLVVIKGFGDAPQDFADAVRRQIAALPGLNQDPEQVEIAIGPRRILHIKGKPIIGFAVALAGLEADGSLAVQHHGIGGRRHMGAGVFVPPPRSA